MKGNKLRLSAAIAAGALFAIGTAQADMMTKVGPGEGEGGRRTEDLTQTLEGGTT